MQMDIKFELKIKQRLKLAEEIATAPHFNSGKCGITMSGMLYCLYLCGWQTGVL